MLKIKWSRLSGKRKKAIATIAGKPVRVMNKDDANRYLTRLLEARHIGLDTETQGAVEKGVRYSALILNRARLLSFQIDSDILPTLVFILKSAHEDGLELSDIRPALKRLLLSKRVKKIMHHANYDRNVFLNHGLKIRNWSCTMLAGACYDENMSNALKERAVLVGMLLKKTRTVDFSDMDDFAQYGGDDAVACHKLDHYYFDEDTHRLVGKRALFYRKQEKPLLNLIIRAERRGIRIDLKKLATIHAKIEEDKTKCLKEIFRAAKKTFNVNANGQLSQVLFDDLGLTPHESCMTKKGVPSTNARSLFYLKGQHPVIEQVQQYRGLTKLQSGYTNPKSGLPYYCDRDGYIHATANQAGAHTFRFTYNNPNLQQIPSRKDTYGIRGCFIPPPGYLFTMHDMSQIEVRIQTVYSRDKIMREELTKKDGDIYLRVAKEYESADPEDERNMYKVIVLALQYGMHTWLLADNLTTSGYPTDPHKAKVLRDKYFSIFKGIPRMWHDLFQEHKRKGHLTTLLGRPRHIKGFITTFDPNTPDMKLLSCEKALINNTMQGSTADWVKQAMLRTEKHEVAREVDWLLGFQVHDEVAGAIKEKYADRYAEVVELAVETPTGMFAPTREMCVPIRANWGVGENWAAAKKNSKEKGHICG